MAQARLAAVPGTSGGGCHAVEMQARAGEDVSATVDEVLDRLRARGSRVTTPRRLLVQSLVSASGHRTAEELAATVQASAPDVNISTIYRNLDELERLGIVVHAHLGHGPATYHLAPAVHGHLVCERCGVEYEAPDELFRSLGQSVMARFGFEIDPHHFAVLGRCAACLAQR
jgi:Fur family transcriptional regulator, ferric uptake regulator